jgi:ATP-dependent Lon protease
MRPELYASSDYEWIRELLDYPETLKSQLNYFETTAEIKVPEDPIERVVLQDRAKSAIRKIVQNRGHILMVGRPGTGKSMLAAMFEQVLDRSMGEYLRPRHAIVAYPGRDNHRIRIAYESPTLVKQTISHLTQKIIAASETMGEFSLSEPIGAVRTVRHWFTAIAGTTALAGLLFPPAFIVTGLTGIGAIFMFIQENQYKSQEKIQNASGNAVSGDVKQLADMLPEILYDPLKETALMVRVAEPDARNMKGGFRHDPYQSGRLGTPAHKRAFLGAHAMAPVIYVDELKTMIKAGYMSQLLEIMQSKSYMLEGGRHSGSGAADRSEDAIRAENIIIACCNHDTLNYIKQEGDGAFLSRIEDKGAVIEMQSAVDQNADTIGQVAQYVKQEVDNLSSDFERVWRDIRQAEGTAGVRERCEQIMGQALPDDFSLYSREFSRAAVMEIIKELRCRAGDEKLSCLLRPVNGVIKSAELRAIAENSDLVQPEHVREALKEHMSLEGAVAREMIQHKRDLKKYITTLTDAIGYVVGLAVLTSRAGGQMYGQPLPIHGQVLAGGVDRVAAPGKIGDIARAAAQNVRASIKKVLKKIDAPYVGYEMHVEYIQAHGGVEGDSASAAMDVALISDYIGQPVNQTIGITGSLTGDLILPVGGVTEKIRSIMDPDLGMKGACIPWQNKRDIQPLLINVEAVYIQHGVIPGIRIFRGPDQVEPFDVFFCKTKFCAYEILMGLDRPAIEQRMIERSRKDLAETLRLQSGRWLDLEGTKQALSAPSIASKEFCLRTSLKWNLRRVIDNQ